MQHACLLTSRRGGGESGGGRERKDITLMPSKVLDLPKERRSRKNIGNEMPFQKQFQG